jgi:hypothetical protein
VVRSASGLRVLAPPRLTERSEAMTIRTRQHLSESAERGLAELGQFLGELARRDLDEHKVRYEVCATNPTRATKGGDDRAGAT